MARPLRLVRPEDQNKMVMIGVRVPAALKARLEAAAIAEDRNLSQECMRRLRLSFECQCGKKEP
jgi:carbamoylphosphate synthase large subunit